MPVRQPRARGLALTAVGLFVAMTACGAGPGRATPASAPDDQSPVPPPLAARADPALAAGIICSRSLPGVRAGSGLLARGSRLLVVQDDVPALAVIDPAGDAIEHLPLIGDGAAMPKATKPDFEAVVEGPGGAVYVIGSGSSSARRRIAKLTRDGPVELIDAAPLHAVLTVALGGDPNIEGAIVVGGRVWLLHRGAGDRPSVLFEVDAAALDGGEPGPAVARAIDLGTIAGVRLTFTDATRGPDGERMIYLAVAEDTPNAIDDGPIRGAAVGVIAGDEARYATLRESDGSPSVRKVEGIVLDPDGRAGWVVTDPDDATRTADLCRLELTGAW
jgi:hypothetical protein